MFCINNWVFPLVLPPHLNVPADAVGFAGGIDVGDVAGVGVDVGDVVGVAGSRVVMLLMILVLVMVLVIALVNYCTCFLLCKKIGSNLYIGSAHFVSWL